MRFVHAEKAIETRDAQEVWTMPIYGVQLVRNRNAALRQDTAALLINLYASVSLTVVAAQRGRVAM